jgi:hypothetical protein
MAAKRAALKLDTVKATKGGTAAPSAQAVTGKGEDKRKGQTLRLSVEAWRQMKLLSFDKAVTTHDLLIEAVNDLFKKNGKPPIA